MMDSELVKEIERFDAVDASEENERNESPKEKAEREFMEGLDKYTDPKVRKLLLKNPELFIPSHDYLLDKINIPPIKLGTKKDTVDPTPPPARRHFTERIDEALSAHIEIGLMNGLIQRQRSDTVSPMHAVEQNGKIRVVMDLSLIHI